MPKRATKGAAEDPRLTAARVLAAVIGRGESLATALPEALAVVARPADRALVQELAYGVLRWHLRLRAASERLLRKPLKGKDLDVQCLILVGLYQLAYLRVPAYAAVAETVAAVRALGKPWLAGLVNAVLRGYQRQAQQLAAELDADPVTALAHPAWLLERLRSDWPEQWQAVVAANNGRAPMTLRVNCRRQGRDDYAERLHQAGLASRPVDDVPSALQLESPTDVAQLPDFLAGAVSVQDAAAQLAGFLLDARAGMRVLDACAAPGGKTGHILEQAPELDRLVAVDQDAGRLQRVDDNLRRLGLAAELVAGDAAEPDGWWDGRPFDRILLDAPCSATGVIRRHPDIKLLRRAADIETLIVQQARLLKALWPLLAPGGMLLYATCSIIAGENSQQVERFLRDHGDARELVIGAGWGHACARGRQILPGEHDMDGFYYARLQKLDDAHPAKIQHGQPA